MRGGPQCREELFLEDGLDGPTHAITKLGLEILAKLQNGRKGCATVQHGVILRVISGELLFEISVTPFSISTGLGTDPSLVV